MKLDVLAIAAHPDDAELFCAGSLVSLISGGKKAGVLDLTRGEKGTRGTPELRLQEAQKAAKIIGLAVRENANLPDSGIENSTGQREAVIRQVRKYRPDICFIHAGEDRHPDHRNAALLSQDALFYAGLSKLETRDESGELQQPWRPFHILHFMQHLPFDPTLVFDITRTMDIKEKAIRAFASQFNAGDDDEGPETFISSPRFFESIRARAREYGRLIGVTYGEPFLYHGGPVPVSDLEFLFSSKPVR